MKWYLKWSNGAESYQEEFDSFYALQDRYGELRVQYSNTITYRVASEQSIVDNVWIEPETATDPWPPPPRSRAWKAWMF